MTILENLHLGLLTGRPLTPPNPALLLQRTPE